MRYINDHVKEHGNFLDKIYITLSTNWYLFSSIQDFYNNQEYLHNNQKLLKPKNGLIFRDLTFYANNNTEEYYYYDTSGKMDIQYNFLLYQHDFRLANAINKLSFGTKIDWVFGKWDKKEGMLTVSHIEHANTPKKGKFKSLERALNKLEPIIISNK